MNHRWLWSALAIAVVVAAAGGWLDNTGKDYAEQAFKRALVTFAVSRTLNGVISVAQGTEVAVEPGGVGVNFTIGQLLDPINDLVERFSGVMLVASSSLGLQNVLLNITGWWGLTAALALVALALLACLWLPNQSLVQWRSTALRFFLVVVFFRFAIPVLVIGTTIVFDTFLAAEQAKATQALEATRNEIESLNEQAERDAAPEEDQSMLDRLGTLFNDSLQSMNVRERIENLRERVSNASEHIINLIVIFVLQTIILPILLVWLFAEGLKSLASRATKL